MKTNNSEFLIGCAGAGQLGGQMIQAAKALGLEIFFYDPNGSCGLTSGRTTQAPWDNPAAVSRFGTGLTHATFEFENVSREFLDALEVPIFPEPDVLEIASNRALEKGFFSGRAIPTVNYTVFGCAGELSGFNFPGVIKTISGGYDGKGQWAVANHDQFVQAVEELIALGHTMAIYEEQARFELECSIIAVRDQQGLIMYYPLVKNEHKGLLVRSEVWHDAPANIVEEAQRHAMVIMKHFDYVGVLCLEMFYVGGKLLANEIAPRVHNSGHWTIEGAATSQFENHLRAGVGMPLGSTELKGHSVMFNLVGTVDGLPELEDLQRRYPGRIFVHLYGKDSRPGRKLGHVTTNAPTVIEARNIALEVGVVCSTNNRYS